ncbi:hypothetical protein PMAYCL1PPCAC_02233, partial [Pristionchus mayeri]
FNVLSFDFSTFGLSDLVSPPAIFKKISWMKYWPDERKQRTVNFKDEMYSEMKSYPSVESFLLMSPAGCYTDAHIDFGGSSFYLHVLKGRKIFFFVPPTEENLVKYEEFVYTKRDSKFFGEYVEDCARVEVLQGQTMIVPAGYIHAVYTPEDSLCFGGNILHTRAAKMQLRVQELEKKMFGGEATSRFVFPFLDDVILHYFASVLKTVTGREYIRPLSLHQTGWEYVG